MSDRYCGCGRVLGKRNTSGRCHKCASAETCRRLNADPANKEKARRTIANWTPEQRAAKAKHFREHYLNMSEEEREARREWGKTLYREYLSKPEIVAKRTDPETLARAGRTKTETMIGWCPPERRDEYRDLVTNGHFTAAEAKAIILDDSPGTVEHARRSVLNAQDAQRIRHERQRAQEY